MAVTGDRVRVEYSCFGAQVQMLGHSPYLDLFAQLKQGCMLRILIADDSRVVRKSLHGLLEQHPEWMVCAEAVDGADAIDKAWQFQPDVIILDFFMPRMTGVEAAKVIGRILPSVPVLIVTLYITAQLIAQAKSVGIKGAVPKSDIRQIVNGVEALMQKNTFFKETFSA